MNRLQKNIEELGFANGLLYTLNRVIFKIAKRNIIYKYYFYVQPVSKKTLLPARLGKKYLIREVKQGDNILGTFDRPAEIIKSRYEQGAICFTALNEEKPVGFIWIITGPYVEDEVRCVFKPKPEGINAWDFDVYICPKERMGIAFALLWQHTNLWLANNHYEWTSSRVSAFNSQSIRSHERLGAARVSSGTFIKLGSIEVALFSKRPYLNFSLNSNKLPVHEIHAPRSI